MAKTPAQKLGYEDREFTTVDGRTLVMGDYFKPDDFAVDERSGAFVKHDALLRVLKKLFKIRYREADIKQVPVKDNGWSGTVMVMYDVVPLKDEDQDEAPPPDEAKYSREDSYSWASTGNCHAGNAPHGFEKYTLVMAETRASGRALRQLLGVEFCTKEELAEKTVDVEFDDSPIKPNTVMMIEKKFMNQKGITLLQMAKLLKKEPFETLDSLTVAEGQDLTIKLNRHSDKLVAENA